MLGTRCVHCQYIRLIIHNSKWQTAMNTQNKNRLKSFLLLIVVVWMRIYLMSEIFGSFFIVDYMVSTKNEREKRQKNKVNDLQRINNRQNKLLIINFMTDAGFTDLSLINLFSSNIYIYFFSSLFFSLILSLFG